MSKPYLFKCSLFLSVLALTATTAHVASADQQQVANNATAATSNSQTPATTTASDTNVQPVATVSDDPNTLALTNTVTTPATTVSNTSATTPTVTARPISPVATATQAPTVTAPVTTATPSSAPVTPVEGQEVDLRILATTDLHTNLYNYDYYQDKPSENLGLAKTAVLIEEAKKENSNVVLVDNGDTIQGTPLGTYKAVVDPIEDGEQHPMYQVLQALGFDASTLGNHEFNYGLDYLNKLIASSGLPLVNANVRDKQTNQLLYTPYVLVPKNVTTKDGKTVTVNVGITGITPPQILNWDKAHLDGKVTVQDAVEAIQAIVPTMRQAGADVVLVLSHSGIGDDKYEKGEENVGYHIASLDGVDAVVTGHSHAEFPSGKGTGFYEKYAGVDGVKGTINGTPVTMGGKYGDHLGVIDLNLVYQNKKWTVADSKASIRKIDTKSNATDQRVLDIAKATHEETIKYVRQQVGTSTAPITSYFALVKDDPSVQIVNNAQLWYGKTALAGTPEANLPLLSAAAPFKAGTRGDATAYTDIPAGAVAIKNVADLYLYDNVTAILKITGAQLKEWLEMSAGQFNQVDPAKKDPQQIINTNYRTYNFDVIDGVNYEIDITKPNKYDHEGTLVNPDASRIVNLTYAGKPVDPAQEFMVVTNNYRASGKFPGVKDASLNRLLGLENRQVIINYIIDQKTINPSADDNWRFADTVKGLDLRFITADRAKSLLGNAKDLKYLAPSTTTDGFGDFQFIYSEKLAPSVTLPNGNLNTNPTRPNRPDNRILNTRIQLPHHTLVLPNQMANQASNLGQDDDSSKFQPSVSHHQTIARAQQAKNSNNPSLPKTGDRTSSVVTLIGLSLLTFAGTFGFKKKED